MEIPVHRLNSPPASEFGEAWRTGAFLVVAFAGFCGTAFGQNGPSVSLYAPAVHGSTAIVLGAAHPGGPEASIAEITWDWGDGDKVSPGWFPQSHTYTGPGVYEVTVTAVQNDGQSASSTTSVMIAPASGSEAAPDRATAPPSAPQPEKAVAILEAAASRYRSASSFRLKGVRTVEQLRAMQSPDLHDVPHVSRTTFTLFLAPDNRFRQETEDTFGVNQKVFDGQKHWTYNAAANTYSSTQGPADPTLLFDGRIDLRFMTDRLNGARIVQEETLDTKGGSRLCDVIRASYDRNEPNVNTEIGDVLFWIDRAEHLVRKSTVETIVITRRAGPESSILSTTLYTEVQMNLSLPADAFTFAPPPGATERNYTALMSRGGTVSSSTLMAGGAPNSLLPSQQDNTGSSPQAEEQGSEDGAASDSDDGGDETAPEDNRLPLSSNQFAYAVGGTVTAPVPIHTPQPLFPRNMNPKKRRGVVVLSIVVDTLGHVSDPRVVYSLDPMLDELAKQTVRDWLYDPAQSDGAPVNALILVGVRFRNRE
jgi:TonB family protein